MNRRGFLRSILALAAAPLAAGFPLNPLTHELGYIANVRDYGAVGDGITDDTEAIQRAIHKVLLSGGGTVRFPAGTYRIA